MNNSLPVFAVNFIAALVLAPLLPGIINKVKAFFAGRKGPRLFQLYSDLGKLLKKECVISSTSGDPTDIDGIGGTAFADGIQKFAVDVSR